MVVYKHGKTVSGRLVHLSWLVFRPIFGAIFFSRIHYVWSFKVGRLVHLSWLVFRPIFGAIFFSCIHYVFSLVCGFQPFTWYQFSEHTHTCLYVFSQVCAHIIYTMYNWQYVVLTSRFADFKNPFVFLSLQSLILQIISNSWT